MEFFQGRKTSFVLLSNAHVDANRNGRFENVEYV